MGKKHAFEPKFSLEGVVCRMVFCKEILPDLTRFINNVYTLKTICNISTLV